MPSIPGVVRFGIFEVDRRTGELHKAGIRIRLQDQPLIILHMLLERPGVVTREEIQARLWPSGTIVEFEHSIGTAIKKLRQALGDDAGVPRYIETLPRRGFRFIAPVDSTATQPQIAKAETPVAGLRSRWTWAVAAALLLVASAVAVFLARRHVPGVPQRTLTRLTFDTGLQFQPTWSPDGRFIAYSSDRGGKFDIWVQQVGAVNPVKITTRPGHNWQPDWSPDGTQIAFRSEGEGGGLFVVPALGGPSRRVSSFGYRPKWSPDGRQILFGNSFISWLTKLYVVGLDGAQPREMLAEFLKKSRIAARGVTWHPGGNRLSIWGEGPGGWGFWTVALNGTGAVESQTKAVLGQLERLTNVWTHFRWAPSGRALYFAGESNGARNLWRIAVDRSSLRFLALERLTTGPGPDVDPVISADSRRLAYVASSARVRAWAFPFDAKSGRLLGSGQAVSPAGFDAWEAEVSPDGKKVLYVLSRGDLGKPNQEELWVTSLPDGESTLLRSGGCYDAYWAPDSQRMAVISECESAQIVLAPRAVGGGESVNMPAFDGQFWGWSPDGQSIVTVPIREHEGGSEYRILLVPLFTATKAEAKTRLVTSSQNEGIYQVRMSPNGRWMVFEAVTGGVAGGATNATLCVVPVSGGPWIRITDGQSWDDKPRWAPNGKTIYYVSSRTGFLNVWGIRFDPEQGQPQGQPFQVTSFESPALMVADDTNGLSLSLSDNRLVLSMKETSGSIWALDNVDR